MGVFLHSVMFPVCMVFINTINQSKIRHTKFPTFFQFFLILLAIGIFVMYWYGMLMMFPVTVVFTSPMTYLHLSMIIIAVKFFSDCKKKQKNELEHQIAKLQNDLNMAKEINKMKKEEEESEKIEKKGNEVELQLPQKTNDGVTTLPNPNDVIRQESTLFG